MGDDQVDIPSQIPADIQSVDEKETAVVFMDGISSLEYDFSDNQAPVRVLQNIGLKIKNAECWGITGQPDYAVRLLLEIMGNIRPYHGGTCVLIGRGMMRHKRVILPHVFYIGDTKMLYSHLNVLEYLMLALAKLDSDRLSLQENLLQQLLGLGLGSMVLTPVGALTEEQKAVVCLVAASYAQGNLILFNFPDCMFDAGLSGSIAQLADIIRRRDNTLVLGTGCCALIEKGCSHTAYIAGGRLLYQGTVENLKRQYDKTLVVMRDKNIGEIRERLAPLLPGYRFVIRDGALYIGSASPQPDERVIYQKMAQAGLVPDFVARHEKTVKNAYEEIVSTYDLPE